MNLDTLIFIIRLPIAIIVTPIIVITMLFTLLIEIPMIISWIIILSIFTNRETIRDSWVSGFPNSTTNMGKIVKNIFIWSSSPSSQSEYIKIHDFKPMTFFFNAISIVSILFILVSIFDIWLTVRFIILMAFFVYLLSVLTKMRILWGLGDWGQTLNCELYSNAVIG